METQTESGWYFERRIGCDVYDVYAFRYTYEKLEDGHLGECVKAEYLSADGCWDKQREGVAWEPALSLPGLLAHMLSKPMSPVYEIERQLAEACQEVVSELAGIPFRRQG